MRCARCGNENPEGYRFCGMCGATMIPRAAAGTASITQPAKTADPAVPAPVAAEPRMATRIAPPAEPTNSSPSFTVPSFLGLNRPADGPTRPSRSLDYLLEDEEEPKRGWVKAALIVIALVLVGGFGYLRFRQGGFDWVTKDRKPETAAESQQPATDSGGSSPASNATPDATNPGAQTPAAGSPIPASSDAPPATTAPGSVAPSNVAAQSAPGDNPAAAKPAESSAEKPTTSGAPRDSSPEDSESAATKPTPEAPIKRAPERKPSPVTPVDTAAEGERYVYGQGVTQDCDRGLRLLKQASQTSLKAMVTMGALYSSGTCAPRDLPTAYRWFAMALHKEPDNQRLLDDLQKLWGQMTPPERQLAIRLSQ